MKRISGVFALVASFVCLLGVFGCGETKTVVIEKSGSPAVVAPTAKETTVIVVPAKEKPSILPATTPPTPVEVRVININTPPASGTAK